MEQVVPKTRAEAETQAEELTKKISSAVTSRAKREREIVRLPDYVAMVAEAKQIDQTADAGQMRLAQIAARPRQYHQARAEYHHARRAQADA